VLDAEVADGVDKRFSRKTGKALQLVFKEGLPGSLDLTSFLLSSFAGASSGFVPDPLFERIERGTASDEGLGV
jgi:hypothetical protein